MTNDWQARPPHELMNHINRSSDTAEEVVRVGDRIMMSVEFVCVLNEQADRLTARVREIRTEEGGTKLIVMERDDTKGY